MAEFTIGLDLAKSVFQVHVADVAGKVVTARQLRRNQVVDFFRKQAPSLIGMEACATAHYWARQLITLGHEVRLLPAQAVKAYVKPGKKNDAADAAAICEAVSRPHIHAVPVKTTEQQAVLVLHRSRALLVDQRTALANALRAHMAEFGIIAAKGMTKMTGLVALLNTEGSGIPAVARPALKLLASQIDECNSRIDAIELGIAAWHKGNETSCNLATIPGVGALTASAIAATMPDASGFASGRQFAAWLGLVPRQGAAPVLCRRYKGAAGIEGGGALSLHPLRQALCLPLGDRTDGRTHERPFHVRRPGQARPDPDVRGLPGGGPVRDGRRRPSPGRGGAPGDPHHRRLSARARWQERVIPPRGGWA